MMSGMFESGIRWIWSLNRSLRFFSRASSSWSARPPAQSACNPFVERAVLGLQRVELGLPDSSSFIGVKCNPESEPHET